MKYGSVRLGTIATCVFATGLWAQAPPTASFNQKFEEGNRLMEEKFFNQSAEVWKELLAGDGDNANLNYKLGFCYFSSYNQKAKAQPYLERASQLRTSGSGSFNTSGYDPFDPKETNSPIEVELLLARAYHRAGELDSADM